MTLLIYPLHTMFNLVLHSRVSLKEMARSRLCKYVITSAFNTVVGVGVTRWRVSASCAMGKKPRRVPSWRDLGLRFFRWSPDRIRVYRSSNLQALQRRPGLFCLTHLKYGTTVLHVGPDIHRVLGPNRF